MPKTEKLSQVCIAILICIVTAVASYAQCTPPTLVQTQSAGVDSVAITWLYFGDAQGWEIELVPDGSSPTLEPSTGILISKEYTFYELMPASRYTVFIRTVCEDDSRSEWNPVVVRTQIPQPSPCLFELPLKNFNCSQGLETFDIKVEDVEGLLGEDVFLSSVDLIMAHTWPADLDIRLLSPEGKEIILSQHNGTVTDDYGNIEDTTCAEVTRFSDQACINIEDEKPPFIGAFIPKGSLYLLENNTPANGIWQLAVCDRSNQDIGSLKYINLNFEPLVCEIPRAILVKSIDATQVEVVWSAFDGCISTEVELVLAGEDPENSIRTTTVNCENESLIIDGLEPGTAYDIYVLSNCNGVKSPLSCPFSFTTACAPVTEVESFDQLALCTPGCAFDCDIGTNWYNKDTPDDQDWLIWDAPTGTDDTGPNNGVFGGGKYIYIEASPEICSPSATAILESTCMHINSNAEACDLSFWYHMKGSDIGTLMLLIQAEQSALWDTLFQRSGGQGDVWHNEVLSLAAYENQAAIFQFVAITAEGAKGDIAIDQIDFRGSTAIPESIVYYQDLDQDGYGNAMFPFNICTTQPGSALVSNADDCNDDNININPEAEEIPCNNIDENCNGIADDNLESNPIEYIITTMSDSCTNPNSGSIFLEVVSGQAPFTIVWNTGDEGMQLSNISAGIFQATISDAVGCEIVTEDILVNQINNLELEVNTVASPSCFGKEDGVISLTGSGGLAPYLYLIDGQVYDSVATNISAGVYEIVAQDAAGCLSDTLTYELGAEGNILADVSFSLPVSCYGGNNGILRVDAITGISPFSYSWNTGDTTQLIEDLAAGDYRCTIVDVTGCATLVETYLSEPEQMMTAIVSQENVLCFGERTGSILTNINGGVPPYSFAWNNGLSTDDIFDLTAGEYQLTVTDANACVAISNMVNITQPPILSAAVDSALAAKCILSADGYLSIKADGGVKDYNYFWSSDLPNESVIDSANAGIYSITITDQNNCKTTISNYELISNSTPLEVSFSVEGENFCFDDSIVSIIATIGDAQLPLDYNWSAGQQSLMSSFSDTLTQLNNGQYALTVTDVDGCIGISDTVLIEAGELITFEVIEKVDNICFSDTNGVIGIVTQGGTGPYSYKWTTGDTTSTIQNLATGKYKVTITDADGCDKISQNISVGSQPALGVDVNITNTSTDMDDGIISLTVVGGIPPIKVNWPSMIANEEDLIATDLATGEYIISLSDANNCDTTFTVVVDIINAVNYIDKAVVSVYPNPFEHTLTIEADTDVNKVSIYSITGSLLMQRDYSNESNVTITTEPLPAGIVVIEVETYAGRFVQRIHKI